MNISRLAGVALGLLALGACAQNMAKEAAAPTMTIVEIAAGSADHSTLVAAVKAADLVDTLSSPGPFTVFAPVNAAFEALPAGTVDNLLKPENKDALTKVLTYHVVPGKVMAAEVIALATANGGTADVTTASGGTLTLALVDGGVQVTDENGRSGTVTTADLEATNGVIHVINSVLVPK